MRSLVLTGAPVELQPQAARSLSGWVRVDATPGPQVSHAAGTLRLRSRSSPDRIVEITLPVNLAGTVHELICLPEDLLELSWHPPGTPAAAPQLTVRRIGWLERVLRMAYRVYFIRAGITEEQRLSADLGFWRICRDIAGAYRAASAFRGRHPSLRYEDWVDAFDTLRQPDIARIQAGIARLPARPKFRVVVLAEGAPPECLEATLASLRAQLYGEFSHQLIDQSSSADRLSELNAALAEGAPREWLLLLRAGDVLPAHALYWYACEVAAQPQAVIVYADDDRIDARGRRSDPRFKPDWSPTHFRSVNYIGAAAIVNGRAAARGGGLTPDCCRHGGYDLLLRAIDAGGEVVRHIPAVLLHRGPHRGGSSSGALAEEDPQWCASALEGHFLRRAIAARVETAPSGRHRIRYPLPDAPPLVSIIVPTRDALELLRQCVESVLRKTTYPRYELLIVDNQSIEPATLAYLDALARRPGVRVLRYRRPFNYSAINNFAAREAAGDLLCLLNNDTEVISPDWLEEMAGHLLQDGVGAVGAKLYYPDGKVQHGGVTVGPGGCANHLHVGIAERDPGYCGRALVAQEYSAVTAACLLTWRRLYLELGGLSERWLPVTFNDVDFCLRLQEAGRRVVFTPHAELYHHESATRGRDVGWRALLRVGRELRYMRSRWRERMKHDPYYNPNFSYQRPDFSYSERSRVPRPW